MLCVHVLARIASSPLSITYLVAVHFVCKFKQPNSLLQYNLNGSNTDGSFTMDDSNTFFSPKLLPIAQEIKYLGNFSYFIMEFYGECTH